MVYQSLCICVNAVNFKIQTKDIFLEVSQLFFNIKIQTKDIFIELSNNDLADR